MAPSPEAPPLELSPRPLRIRGPDRQGVRPGASCAVLVLADVFFVFDRLVFDCLVEFFSESVEGVSIVTLRVDPWRRRRRQVFDVQWPSGDRDCASVVVEKNLVSIADECSDPEDEVVCDLWVEVARRSPRRESRHTRPTEEFALAIAREQPAWEEDQSPFVPKPTEPEGKSLMLPVTDALRVGSRHDRFRYGPRSPTGARSIGDLARAVGGAAVVERALV